MFEWIAFALIGILSGLSSGLLGLGGGVIIVPALLMVFSWQGLIGSDLMHMAVATSLMTIIITSLTSAYSHNKHDHVNWKLVRKLAPALVLGGLLGAVLATQLSSKSLQQFFALYLFFAAVKMWVPNPATPIRFLLNKPILMIFGCVTGVISSLVGIGGGTLVVPYLVMANQSIHRAIGTSATCGLPIAVSAVCGFIVVGQLRETSDTIWQSSLVYWPAFWGIISTSSLFAIVGVKLAKRLPVLMLKQIFSVVLLIGALYLALDAA